MQAALLEQTGLKVSHQTLRKWEVLEDQRIPGPDKIEALCTLFAVQPRFFLEDLIGPSFNSPKNSRINRWTDVDALREEDHELLLAIKARLLSKRDSS